MNVGMYTPRYWYDEDRVCVRVCVRTCVRACVCLGIGVVYIIEGGE